MNVREPKKPDHDCVGPVPGTCLREKYDGLGLSPGWVQRCDACGRYPTDLDALNASRRAAEKRPLAGYPFGLVDADWEGPREQRLTVKLELAVTLRTEGAREIQNSRQLGSAVTGGFLVQLRAILAQGGKRELARWLELVDCESVVDEVR